VNCTVATVCALLIAGPVKPVPLAPFSGGHCYADPDRLEIADAGMGRAIVTYYNSGFGCSVPMDKTMTSPNGVTVHVRIETNANGDRERITVTPQTEGMFADPPVDEIKDGEETRVVIQGGMS
jgi:hypothetical protein